MTSQSQALSVFNFKSNTIRVIADDKGEPWFLANDVCNVLGYVNPRDAIAKHCRTGGVAKRDTPTECDVAKRDTSSKARESQEMTYINEGNLYRLIIKSRKPEAEPFESWVCDEVLPSIRKTGKYEINPPPANPHLALTKTIKQIGKGNRQHYSDLYKRVYDKFQVTSYKELTTEQCVAAIDYVRSVEGEYISRDKIEAPKPSLALCDGQHYVVAKDGAVLMHKVLSHDINDSCLKTMGIGQDKFEALKKDLAQFCAPEDPHLQITYSTAQRTLSMLSALLVHLENHGLNMALMYQKTQFVQNFLTNYYSRLEAIHYQMNSISKNMSLDAINYAADISKHPTVVSCYGAKIA